MNVAKVGALVMAQEWFHYGTGVGDVTKVGALVMSQELFHYVTELGALVMSQELFHHVMSQDTGDVTRHS